MKCVAPKTLNPLWSACALVLAGALLHGTARAGETPVSGPDIAQYLRLHDEETRVGARMVDSARGAAGEACVRQAEQPRPNRKGVRG